MNMQELNLTYMKEGFEELYERVQDLQEPSFSHPLRQLETITSVDGVPVAVVESEEGVVARLNSEYSPEHECEVWLSQFEERKKAKNIFVLGLSNAVLVKKVIEDKAQDAKVVIYEPCTDLFCWAFNCCDLTMLFSTKGVRLIVEGVNEDMYSNVMEEMLTYENMEDRLFLIHPQYEMIFEHAKKSFLRGYSDGVGRLMSNRNTIRRFLTFSPRNQFINLGYMPDGVTIPELRKNWDSHVPVVIIGAGPSLREHIDLLKRAQGKMILLAVDTAIDYLLEQGVRPDLHISVEAGKPDVFFQQAEVNHIPLICKSNTSSELTQQHKGKKIFCKDEPLAEKICEKYGIACSHFRFGGGVATSAFAVCADLGVKTVIWVGQDMAYSEDQSSHALSDKKELFVEDKDFLMKANDGSMVQSRQDWYRFVKWYENAIPVCGFTQVINTALHGVKVRGADYIPFETVLKQYHYTTFSVEQCLEDTACMKEKLPIDFPNCEYSQFDLELSKAENYIEKKDWKALEQLEIYPILSMYDIGIEDGQKSRRLGRGCEWLRKYLKEAMEA